MCQDPFFLDTIAGGKKTPLGIDERDTALLQATRSDDMGVLVVVLDDWVVLRLSSILERSESRLGSVDFVGTRAADGPRGSRARTSRYRVTDDRGSGGPAADQGRQGRR